MLGGWDILRYMRGCRDRRYAFPGHRALLDDHDVFCSVYSCVSHCHFFKSPFARSRFCGGGSGWSFAVLLLAAVHPGEVAERSLAALRSAEKTTSVNGMPNQSTAVFASAMPRAVPR